MTFNQKLLLLLVGVGLTACGGDGASIQSLNPKTAATQQDSTVTTTPVTTTPVTSTPAATLDPVLSVGTGSGDDFNEGAILITSTELAVGGSTGISVNVVNTVGGADTLYAGGDSVVSFTSTCAGQQPALAQIESPITTSGGVVNTTYTSTGCEGEDTITATLTNGATAIGKLVVAKQEVDAIAFVSATEEVISLKGVSNAERNDRSDLEFRVIDKNDDPVKGAEVTFDLSSRQGGVSLSTDDVADSGGIEPVTIITGVDGIARTTLIAGSVNTAVRVIAKLKLEDGSVVETNSNPIAMNSGYPRQDSFDIVADYCNTLGYGYNGVERTISISAGDFYNNPVPDGTQVSFTAESGLIDGACSTAQGRCSVTWVSGGLRPADGAVTILARSVGEEYARVDSNANGLFDVGDLSHVDQLGEAYLDNNEDGVFQVDIDQYFDFDSNGAYTLKDDVFNGVSCSVEAQEQGHCGNLIEVRDSLTLILSSSSVGIQFDSASLNLALTPAEVAAGTTSKSQTVCYGLFDENNNRPPANTSVSVTATNGRIVSGKESYEIYPTCSTKAGDAAGVMSDCVTVESDGDSGVGELKVAVTLPAPASSVRESSIPVVD